MHFPNIDDEEEDFSLGPSSRSRLSSLFQVDHSSGDVNQALTYTAPKQPKKTDGAPAESLRLIHAVVAHGYKLENGKYANQGKLGCAVLGNRAISSYKLLLYKGKQIQVTACNIVPSFMLHIQPNNYTTFYDDKKENWSLNFDSEATLVELAKQVALAKANSQGKNMASLVIQDLVMGEGSGIETGDSIEIKYTGWLLTNNSFGEVFDSNVNTDTSCRIRLGKNKAAKVWNQALQGAQKNGKRLLIIPSKHANEYEGVGVTIPQNSSLIFEISIVRVKHSREASHSPSPIKVTNESVEKKPDVPPRTHSLSQEDSVRMRGASISEQLSQSPKKDKAQLISRMAKMGTATLPLQGAIPAQVSSESENEAECPREDPTPSEVSSAPIEPSKTFPKPRSRASSGSAPVIPTQPIPVHMTQHSSQVSLYAQAAVPSQHPYMPSATVPFHTYQPQVGSHFQMSQSQFPIHSMAPSVSTPNPTDNHLPFLLSETFNQNAEVRMNLSKITDKVDSVIQKVDDIRLHHEKASNVGTAPLLEAEILAQNIERILHENTRLKEEAEQKNSKIQSLNEKVYDLLQRNQRFFEESNCILEQRNDSMQASSAQIQTRISSLEHEKVKLSEELRATHSKFATLQEDFSEEQNSKSDLSKQVHELDRRCMELEKLREQHLQEKKCSEDEIASLKVKLEQMSKGLKQTKESLEKQKHERVQEVTPAASEDQSHTLNEELNKLKAEKESEIQTLNDKILALQAKLNTYMSSDQSYQKKINDLEAEIQNIAQMWKQKCEALCEKAREMREAYETEIRQLNTEIESLQTHETSAHFSAGEIKKMMNTLFKLIQAKFDESASYSGPNALKIVLDVILGHTYHVLHTKCQVKQNDENSQPASSSQDNSNKTETQDEVAITPEVAPRQCLKQEPNTDKNLGDEKSRDDSRERDQLQTEDYAEANGFETVEKTTECGPEEANLEMSANETKSHVTEVLAAEGTENKSLSTVNDDQLTNDHNEVQHIGHKSAPESLSCAPENQTWRPQPPPLFDDDDDDDEDDDWLK